MGTGWGEVGGDYRSGSGMVAIRTGRVGFGYRSGRAWVRVGGKYRSGLYTE